MNDSFDNSREIREIKEQAAEWVLRHDRGLDAAEREEHARWLAADPRHVVFFAQHQRAWDQLGGLGQLRPAGHARPDRALLAPPPPASRRRGWIIPFALAAAAAVMLIFWHQKSPKVDARPFPAFALANGRNVLPDGSVVVLDRGARAEVRFTSVERGIELTQGDARFAVAKNRLWPFVVHASGVAIRAVGTAFVVRLGPESVEVLVTEGRVQVSPPLTPGISGQPYLVAAGEEKRINLQVPAARPPLVAPAPAAPNNRPAGPPALIDLDGMPLSRVVLEFNQRNRVQFVVADPDLDAMPMSGRVRFDDVDGFVTGLGTFGIEAQSDGNRIILHRKR